MGVPNQTWRNGGTTYPRLLGSVAFADLPDTTIDSTLNREIDGIRFIPVGASAAQQIRFGGGSPARKIVGDAGTQLMIPLADLGYVAGYARRPLALVATYPSGLGRADGSGASGILVGFSASAASPFTTSNYHGNTDLGRWFSRSNFGGGGNFVDIVGASGSPFPAVLSASNRVYASALYTQGFVMNSKITAPASADPGSPSGPADAVLVGPYSNAFRTVDDDTLFTQGSEADRPYAVLNFALRLQDGGLDTPTLGSIALYALEPPA